MATIFNGHIPKRGDRVGLGQQGMFEVMDINSVMQTADLKSTDRQGHITRNVPWKSLGELYPMYAPAKEIVAHINMARGRVLVWQTSRDYSGFRCTECGWDRSETTDRRSAELGFDKHICAKYPIKATIKIV